MAEVSDLHRRRQPPSSRSPASTTIGPHQGEDVHPEDDDDDDFYHQANPFLLDFDSFPPPINSSNPSLFDDYATTFDLGFDLNAEAVNLGCEYQDPNCFFFGGEEDDEQMNFVTDLFETRQPHAAEDLIWELGSGRADDSAREFGFGPGLGASMGLRAADIDSDSDSEEFEVIQGLMDNDDDNFESFGVSNHSYYTSENDREEFEWEEVSERINFDERENLNLAINQIEELSVSSDLSSSEIENSIFGDDDEEALEEEERNVEWEFLLAVNNLERTSDFDGSEENNNGGSELPRINLPEDYILTMEYDALFGQLVENENALKGSPPAAKSVVENLPLVVLTKEEFGGDDNNVAACAVCKDEFALDESVAKLPCCHLYHGECILPWLDIRNTCPVCRYELPTDDADYEKRRSNRVGSGVTASLINEFEVRYNFELLP
ncbi:PREDICTED: E3 ubiquitin-protein ligase Praja-1 [Erythranthe guttata]|uniref:E3 ubiquitin-protein ligase Praja-1 n=1 Tax=Erythranthe guttata TaxID=4155 RepID=UPI00064DC64A|nr:PREDICTED: E3 ubiquitin-protein ligase Praja-1 [Erythranthe guttata]|eukprot:XP_012852109.1 PREDICTED: E3 ubiquitin-protein ligase Praja-1 [Erythranthe guttata]